MTIDELVKMILEIDNARIIMSVGVETRRGMNGFRQDLVINYSNVVPNDKRHASFMIPKPSNMAHFITRVISDYTSRLGVAMSWTDEEEYKVVIEDELFEE